MPVKANWQNGEQFNASDANDVATAVNAAYVKPGTGVPITDLSSAVQVSLGKADTAVQAVAAVDITDSTATGRAVLTAADAAAARTTLGVAYGTSAGTVVQGNDSRLSPTATSITDSTVTGRAVLTAVDAAAARTTLGVAYGSAAGTVVQGNDSRVTGAEQSANKGVANGYASLDSGGKVPVAQLPSSIMEYQGTYNASTNSPSLSNGTGNTGDVYRVSVAGSRNFGAGAISFEVGDYVIYNGSVWEKSDTTDAVSTVAGLTGDVTASALRGAIATGTPSSSTYLRGDGSWATIPASGITRSVATVSSNTNLGSAANTDYVAITTSGITLTLPTAASNSNLYTVKNVTTAQDANTLTLLRFEDTAGATTFSNIGSNSSWTFSSATTPPITSATQFKFGARSLTGGSSNNFGGNYIKCSSAHTAIGTGDFTVEFFFRATSFGGDEQNFNWGIMSIRTTSSTPRFRVNGVNVISGSALTAAQWYHLAVSRSGTSTRMFVDGTQVGSTYTDTNNYTSTDPQLGGFFSGFYDDLRISNNARYTANFTAPTSTLDSTSTTIGTTSSQTIDGVAPPLSVATGQVVALISDGSNWRTI